jgi:hypothetical protein
MTYTTFSDGFAAFIDPAAPNLGYILDTAAGDSSAYYDMDAALKDYVEEINRHTLQLGVCITLSGVSYLISIDSNVDSDDIKDAALSVDVYDILDRHDISKK